MISKIETGERPPAEDFPPRLDAVPELDTRGALTRLWEHLKKGQKQRLYGWFQEWADIEAQATAGALVRAGRLLILARVAHRNSPPVAVVSVVVGGCRWWCGGVVSVRAWWSRRR